MVLCTCHMTADSEQQLQEAQDSGTLRPTRGLSQSSTTNDFLPTHRCWQPEPRGCRQPIALPIPCGRWQPIALPIPCRRWQPKPLPIPCRRWQPKPLPQPSFRLNTLPGRYTKPLPVSRQCEHPITCRRIHTKPRGNTLPMPKPCGRLYTKPRCRVYTISMRLARSIPASLCLRPVPRHLPTLPDLQLHCRVRCPTTTSQRPVLRHSVPSYIGQQRLRAHEQAYLLQAH